MVEKSNEPYYVLLEPRPVFIMLYMGFQYD